MWYQSYQATSSDANAAHQWVANTSWTSSMSRPLVSGMKKYVNSVIMNTQPAEQGHMLRFLKHEKRHPCQVGYSDF